MLLAWIEAKSALVTVSGAAKGVKGEQVISQEENEKFASPALRHNNYSSDDTSSDLQASNWMITSNLINLREARMFKSRK